MQNGLSYLTESVLPTLRMSDPPVQCFFYSRYRPDLFRDLDDDRLTWRQDHLLEEDVRVELGHGVAGVKDQVSAGVDSPDGLERLSRVAEVCHQDVAVSSAVEPLQLDNVLLEINDLSSRPKFCAFRFTRIFILAFLAKTRNFHPRRFLVLNAVAKKKNHKFKPIGSTPWPYHHEIKTPPQFSKCR